jgi:hypothetical protein
VAIDDLPMPVVTFLNAIGVDWPYINEDTLMQFASLTREFGQAVENTHQEATTAVHGIAQAHQGASTQQMTSGWSELSSRHVTEIVDACQVLSAALEAAAAYIVAQKLEAIADLIGMAAAFVADEAASVLTLGLAEAALPVIIEAGEALVDSLAQDLQQYLIGKVIGAAAKPLFAKVEAAMAGLDWSQTTPVSGSAATFMVDEQAIRTQTAALRTHAQTMRSHATTFQQGVRGLSF